MPRQQLILLVEDNEDNRIVYRTILNYHTYAVLEAVNGSDGVHQAVRHRPDLILMDLSMPVMDGWTAVRQIRQDESTSQIPVIAITAHDLDSDEWRSAGFSGYLQKPVEPSRIVEEIRRNLPPQDSDPA